MDKKKLLFHEIFYDFFPGRKDAEFLASTAIQTSQKLKKLEITHCPKLSDDCLATILEFGTNLEHLNLECTSISTHWGAGQITKLKNLRYLNLFNCRLFDSSDLISLSYNCEYLECLNIEEVSFVFHLSIHFIIFSSFWQKIVKSIYTYCTHLYVLNIIALCGKTRNSLIPKFFS